jgi:Mn2+/Fe2+ NRAMP family transporter
MTNDRAMMGDKANSLGTNLLGWITALVTFLAAVFLVVTWVF